MKSDTLILECPECKEQFPITVYSGQCSGKVYGIDNAPLCILAEVNSSSKREEIQCIQCGLTIALQILYLPYVRPFSSVQFEGWKSTKGISVS